MTLLLQSNRCTLMKKRSLVLLLLFVFPALSHASNSGQVVLKFVDAYNAQNVDAMLALATDKLTWLYFKDNQLQVLTSGKTQMKEELLKDFKNKKGGRSEIRKMFALNDTVSVIEEAFWEKEGELKSQCAVSIYRLAGNLIDSVTYYDSAPCDQIDSVR